MRQRKDKLQSIIIFDLFNFCSKVFKGKQTFFAHFDCENNTLSCYYGYYFNWDNILMGGIPITNVYFLLLLQCFFLQLLIDRKNFFNKKIVKQEAS